MRSILSKWFDPGNLHLLNRHRPRTCADDEGVTITCYCYYIIYEIDRMYLAVVDYLNHDAVCK